MKAGIVFNLKKNPAPDLPDAEAEFDDEETVYAIRDAIEAAGFSAELYEADDDLPVRLLQSRPGIVFNIAEGKNGRGREAHVPALCSYLGIPFTGSDETAMCIAMDKALAKRIAASAGVRTPDYRVVKSGILPGDPGLSFPLIIKPNSEGSSKGISNLSIASDRAGLNRILEEKMKMYQQDMLLEEYIDGREFTVGILGNGDKLRVFPPMEIIFGKGTSGIYSYEVKRNFRQHVSYKCPPDINAGQRKEMETAAETVFRVMECRDCARIDFRLSAEGRLYFIEINPLPGLAPGYSDFPMLAEFSGMDYTALVGCILENALARYGLNHTMQ